MKKTRNKGPAMSVVIVTPDHYDTIRKTIRHLRAQTAKAQLEIVIVTPSAGTLKVDQPELSEFYQYRIIEVGEIRAIAWANASGVRAAAAPVVVLAEDHSFPEPEWAEALIKAHYKDWAAVGPVVRNANPETRVSWADLLMAYGPWLDPHPGGEVDHLPGHNSSYKLDILLEYGTDLDGMMESESILHWDLRRKGYRLYLETSAKIHHMNFGLMSSWLKAQYHSKRVFAAARARDWPLLKRVLYAGGSPLIPLVRVQRILKQLRRIGRPPNMPFGVLVTLMVGLSVSAIGEMVGYSVGAGVSKQKLSHFEFHRVRHVPLSRIDSDGS